MLNKVMGGALNLFIFGAHLSFWNMGDVIQFLNQKLAHLLAIFWFSFSTFFLPLFRFDFSCFFRLKVNYSILNKKSSSLELNSIENSKIESSAEPEMRCQEAYRDSESDEFCLSFKFPTFEEFNRSKCDDGDFINSEIIHSSSSSKYEFVPANSFSTFIEEIEPVRFKVEEINGDCFGIGEIKEDELLFDKDSTSLHSKAETDHIEIKDLINGLSAEDLFKKNDGLEITGDQEEAIDEEDYVSDKKEESLLMDSGLLKSISSTDLHSVVGPYADDFLSDGEAGGMFELDHLMDMDGQKEEPHDKLSKSDESQEFEDLVEEDRHVVEGIRILKEETSQTLNKFKSDYKFGSNSGKDKEFINSKDNSEIKDLKNGSVVGSDEVTNKLETLWEHQDLIEQLKMELKKVRATGLPTILEESESPKLMEDLQPWKIDEKKFHYDNSLHKFYKSYSERMRKFDILNYQKMYAIGFLQLKDPHQTNSMEKTSVSDIASILWDNLYLYKSKKHETDPMKKFIRELQSDLESVYVGQMCLSWEILHWQYEMALDIWESDPHEMHSYNEVAGEFQQFQVLLQRFLEDESVQGSRVQNYIKNRCVLRNLLQVPIIRDDISYEKKARISKREEYYVTSNKLVEILEESIRIFWLFVHADKYSKGTADKSRKGQIERQDPADSHILKEVYKDFHKKERKLKDQMRSGNCILKKCREDESDQVLIFFSQVDMKLVSRVLNMSGLTTDQLTWCRNKLNKISFVNRRIHVEPSFCLFPCS